MTDFPKVQLKYAPFNEDLSRGLNRGGAEVRCYNGYPGWLVSFSFSPRGENK